METKIHSDRTEEERKIIDKVLSMRIVNSFKKKRKKPRLIDKTTSKVSNLRYRSSSIRGTDTPPPPPLRFR